MQMIFNISQFSKLKLLILLVHILGMAGLIFYWDPKWFLLTAVCHLLFLWIGQEMYVHRFLSHNSFKLNETWQSICALLSVFNLFGSPIGIAATHVTHHKYSDKEKDPHPASYPIKSWIWTYHLFETSNDIRTVKKLTNNKLLKFIAKEYFKIYLITVFIFALIDVRIVIYGFFVHVMYAFFSNGMINVLCHKYGYRLVNTKDNSRNNIFVNIMLFGSGIAMHNTHHAYPNDWNLSRSWYEFDFVGKIINLIRLK